MKLIDLLSVELPRTSFNKGKFSLLNVVMGIMTFFRSNELSVELLSFLETAILFQLQLIKPPLLLQSDFQNDNYQ